MRALELLERLQQLSPGLANAAVSGVMRYHVPLAAIMGVKVEEISEARAQASMPLRFRVRNHMKDVYVGAQMTLLELTMAMWLLRRYPLGRYGLLVKRVEADFKARAKGDVRAVCEPPADVLASLEGALRNAGDKAEAWLPAKLMLGDGTVVTEARFLAALKKF